MLEKYSISVKLNMTIQMETHYNLSSIRFFIDTQILLIIEPIPRELLIKKAENITLFQTGSPPPPSRLEEL